MASRRLGLATDAGGSGRTPAAPKRYVLLRAANDNLPALARWLIERAARLLLYASPLIALAAIWYWIV